MHRPTEVSALFKRAVSVRSVLCQCALTGTETLRVGRMCANSRGGYVYRDAKTTFRECTNNDD